MASKTCTTELLFSFVNCDEESIHGYAISTQAPLKPLLVELLIDGNLFASLRCVELLNVRELDLFELLAHDEARVNEFTAALNGTRIIVGGFSYVLPPYLPRERPLHFVVREQGTGTVIFDARLRLDQRALEGLSLLHDTHPRTKATPLALTTDRLKFQMLYGGTADVGKLVARASQPGVVIQQQPAQRLDAPPAGWYPHRQDVAFWSLTGEVDLRTSDGSAFEIRLHDAESGDVRGAYQNALFVPADCAQEYARWSIPDDKFMTRVMGYANPLHYYLGGYATFKSIDRALRTATSRSVAEFPSILDWGSGAGRVSQQIVRRTNSAVQGIDIDPDNVDWTNHHLAPGVFAVTPLLPEAPLPAATFDLIVGMSVFTHLDEPAQWAWLQELHRLLRPGGTLVVSIKSMFALYLDPHPVQSWWLMKRNGIDATVAGSLLDEVSTVGPTSAYYRETNHSHEYILDRWSKWFDVLGIYVGAFFDYQDICVLRRRDVVDATPRLLPVLSADPR
jgi:SAM-dependent methyltransferase